jgi:Tfp pilus assembly protein FimT
MMIESEKGVTLIELMIAFSIAAVIVIALGFEFRGWMGRYKAESQIKEMYVDIMNTRARAMQRNRFHMIVLTADTYTVNEDLNDNEAVDAAEKLLGYPKTFDNFTLWWSGAGDTITFNTRGLVVPPTRTIRAVMPVSSDPDCSCTDCGGCTDPDCSCNQDYDCIAVLETKTNMGKWDKDEAKCKIR